MEITWEGFIIDFVSIPSHPQLCSPALFCFSPSFFFFYEKRKGGKKKKLAEFLFAYFHAKSIKRVKDLSGEKSP